MCLKKSYRKKNDYISKINEKINVNLYTDYKEMLEKEEIDVVTIATESGYHPEIAINCMDKKKHIICEKPMALSVDDADRMIESAKKNNVKLCVSHQNRFKQTNTTIKKSSRS